MKKRLIAAAVIVCIATTLLGGPASADETGGLFVPPLPSGSDSGIQPMIVDGEVADRSDGLAALHRNGNFICTASIIAATWVLTARHCVERNDGTVISATYQVRVKSLNRSSGGGMVTVNLIKTRDIHDIALLRLDRSANADYVKLATQHAPDNATGYLFGWGVNLADCPDCVPNYLLKRATVKMTAIAEYSLNWGGGTVYFGTGIHAVKGNGISCSGDSGGPVFKLVDGARYQVGVVSGGDCVSNDRYASVPISLHWIEDVMAQYS